MGMSPDMAEFFPSPGSISSTVASESDVRDHRLRHPLLVVDSTQDEAAHWQKRRGWCFVLAAALSAGALLGVAIGCAIAGIWPSSWPDACFDPASCGDPDTCKRFALFGRDVWVYQPRSGRFSPMQPLPVVVVLHGSYGCALQMAKISGFQETAEEAQFLVVYPEMMHMGDRDWAYDDPREVSFFTAMIEMLSYEFNIDRKEVFVCGFSAGGTMALFLQNNYPGYFYAAASVEAGMPYVGQWDNRSTGRPVAVFWNHNDAYLQNHGGRTYYQRTLRFLLHDPSRDSPSQVRQLPATGAGVLYAKQLHWDAWGQRPPVMVVSWATAEPTHVWPSPASIPGCFDAARIIWKFFVSTRSDWDGVVPIVTDGAPPKLADGGPPRLSP